jgi:hypothetical protein
LSTEEDDPRSLVKHVFERGQARDRAIDRSFAKRRGVVHTPSAVARFMLEATDEILKDELGLTNGLAWSEILRITPNAWPFARVLVVYGPPVTCDADALTYGGGFRLALGET